MFSWEGENKAITIAGAIVQKGISLSNIRESDNNFCIEKNNREKKILCKKISTEIKINRFRYRKEERVINLKVAIEESPILQKWAICCGS